DHHLAVDRLAEDQWQARLGPAVARRLGSLAETHQLAVRVWHLESDHALARDRSFDADGADGHGQGQVVGEVREAADLLSRRRLDLEARDSGAPDGGRHPATELEVGERLVDLRDP